MTKLRIGSRGSKLALVQAHGIGRELKKVHPDLEISFVTIQTTGDRDSNSSLTSLGGKGVFVKEIEEALLRNEIDCAVHSLKDVPQALPAGLRLGPTPQQEDSRDALISRTGISLNKLPENALIGTSSPRRRAVLTQLFPKKNFRFESIRGNVDTRIRKLREGQYEALILAVSGLCRLGLESEITERLDPLTFLPAPGQGCLGLELRSDDSETLKIIDVIKDEVSDRRARAERAFLHTMGGNCLVPLGAHTEVNGDSLKMIAAIYDTRGTRVVRVEEVSIDGKPEILGAKLANRLLAEGGSQIMSAL